MQTLRSALSRHAWQPHQVMLIAILAGFVILATVYSLVTPLFEASDELWHYPMVKYMTDHSLGLPVLSADPNQNGPWRQEGGQPPLYYMIGAVATVWIDTSDMDQVRTLNPHPQLGVIVPDGNVNMVAHHTGREDFPWEGTVLAMRIVRFLSILMSLGTVYLTYRLGRELFPDTPAVALAAAAFTAFNPMFLFISGVINNDNLSTLVASLLLVLIARLIKRRDSPPSVRFYVLLGVVAGAGMLAKFQIGFMLPLIALALLIVSIRQRDWRPVVIGGLISGGLTILIAGWWYWRNYDIYGDATGINIFLDTVGRREVPADLRQLWTERETFMMSFWGFFGGVNVPLPDGTYTVFNILAALSLVGLLIPVGRRVWHGLYTLWNLRRYSWRMIRFYLRNRRSIDRLRRLTARLLPFQRRGSRDEDAAPLAIARLFAFVWPVIVFISLLSWTRLTWASQGRLWFSAIAALSVWMAVGLANWAQNAPRITQVNLGVASAVFVVIAILAPFTAIRPAYTLDRDADWDADEMLETAETHTTCFVEPGADQPALCTTYELLSGSLTRGEYLKFSPAFEVTGPLTRDWSLFVHLVEGEGVPQAQRDVYPGGGLLLTSEADPGDTWNNPIAVPVGDTLYAPQTLDVYLGLYDMRTFERMQVVGGLADDTDRVYIGQITLEPRPLNKNFNNKLRLIDYDITARTLIPGEQTTITLRWEALNHLSQDYVISIQVLRPGTQHQIAHLDAPPTPPTTTWIPGEEVVFTQTLTIFEDEDNPENNPSGQYRVLVKVYPAWDWQKPLRLRAGTGGQSESSLWLNWIEVK